MRSSVLCLVILLIFCSCNRKKKIDNPESRTSGKTSLLVDESFSRILSNQIRVFESDYPSAKISTVLGNEAKILPKFTSGEQRLIVLSRMLKPEETRYYQQNKIPVNIDRFAVDGIALITNSANVDTLITAQEVYDILRGKGNKKLVFDNANSSTVRYFMDSAQVSTLPKSGVYTLNSNVDVIKYVAENKDYIGVLGINWLLGQDGDILTGVSDVKVMSVSNLEGEKGDGKYYQPTQNNLINGNYPFLRNIYIINCEGKNGLGTGFANWLCGRRGQLIVLKSGLGPHKIEERILNYK
ncbi:MAG: phosphate ABC transporter substrate-binding protein [Pedobacter sp.]|nr:MAG: phosphate ABC transporter substrate-binding protein [Pedobacter sp.]